MLSSRLSATRRPSARLLVAGAAFALLTISGTAAATTASSSIQLSEDSDFSPRVLVKFADLDLSTDAGAGALLRRLEAAAAQVCGNPRRNIGVLGHDKIEQCNSAAIAHAVAEISAPKVTAVYRARHPAAQQG